MLALGGDPMPLLEADDPVLIGLLLHVTGRAAEITAERERIRFEAIARMLGAKK